MTPSFIYLISSKINFMQKLLLIPLVLLMACNNTKVPGKTTEIVKERAKPEKKQKLPEIKIKTEADEVLTVNSIISFNYTTKSKQSPDSIIWVKNNKRSLVNSLNNKSFNISANDMPTGTQRFRFDFHWGDSVVVSKYKQLTLWSDLIPNKYGFKVKSTFPHDTKAYTQGLEFADGLLYEGTGQTGESTLSKYDLDKNELLHQVNLPNDVFGEGITILKDKIYQITWQSQVGFVYDKVSLRKLYEFTYPTEGWGLCNNGENLIMSDGSEQIYFLDTEFMQETHRLQVYDNNGPVSRLNELEYVDGLIYANIYGTDNIVAFEEKTGRVVKRINMKGLLNKRKVSTPIDVLNGIAWDETNQRMIVTGKWWPKLFHVDFVTLKN